MLQGRSRDFSKGGSYCAKDLVYKLVSFEVIYHLKQRSRDEELRERCGGTPC